MQEIQTELEAIAAKSTRSTDDDVRWAQLLGEFNTLNKASELDEVRRAAGGGHTEAGTVPGVPVQRDSARRALDELRGVHDEGRERLTRTFERAEGSEDGGHELSILSRWLVATSSPAYSRAVAKLFRDPTHGHREFTGEELDAFQRAKVVERAMSIGTDSAGGFLLPTHLDPQIMLSNAGAIDPMRQIARHAQIATSEWHGVSSAGVTASWDGEAAEVSDDSPTLAQPTVPVHKAQAFIAASIEAAEDTSIQSQVTNLFLDAKARLESAAFWTGSGTNQPTGLITALGAGQKVAAATADTLVAADLTGLQVVLSPRWQPRARWAMNLETINGAASLETTAGNLRFPEMANGTLLRKPFHECSELDGAGDTAAAGNDNVAVYGDFSNYLIVDRIGATVEFIPHLFATGANRPSGQRGWYLYWRVGGDALIDDAFRLLTA